MGKSSKSVPTIPPDMGDRVRRRGFQHIGTVAGTGGLGGRRWLGVKWDNPAGRETPSWCDESELERLPETTEKGRS